MEMQYPDGPIRMWFAGEYLEVVENKRLRYTEAMSDENGNLKVTRGKGTAGATQRRLRSASSSQDLGGNPKMVMTHVGVAGDSRVPPDGRWHSTGSPPTSQHTTHSRRDGPSNPGWTSQAISRLPLAPNAATERRRRGDCDPPGTALMYSLMRETPD